MSNIYIIGAGTIGRALAGVLRRHRRDVVLVRASEAVPPSLLRLRVVYEGVPIEEEVAVCGLQDVVRFDGVVVVATKSYGNAALAGVLKDKVGDSPVVIMQNGLGVEDAFLREGIGNVYRCVLFATSQYQEDGGVVFKPVTASPIGVVDGRADILSSVVDAINTPVFPFAGTPDITPIAWSKTIANCVFNSVCPLLETDNGIFHRNEEALGLARKIIAECVAVAELEGIRISAEEVTARLLLISKASDGQLISTLQDIRSGRPTEIDTLNFAVARAAEAKGRDVPVTKALGELVRLKSLALMLVFVLVFLGCRGPVKDGGRVWHRGPVWVPVLIRVWRRVRIWGWVLVWQPAPVLRRGCFRSKACRGIYWFFGAVFRRYTRPMVCILRGTVCCRCTTGRRR
ncbi:ketopantoate reductase family protein [Puia sp. P3]|uniref:ketopantoate reductase family protein n=1 Tax=Puia sp. P3 TaxID=3423952 RepID=UPI003D66518B